MRHVLLAVDGSPASDQAVRLLAHLPHRDRLELTILTVIEPVYIHGSYAATEMIEQVNSHARELAEATHANVCEKFDGANVLIHHEYRQGNIGETIVQAAKELNVDLVVVGATGRSQLSRVLLGSVSDHVATHAPCSVLVVRPSGLEDSPRPIRVCLGYEGGEPAKRAIAEIGEIPWTSGTEFHVVSIVTYLLGVYGELIHDEQSVKQHDEDLKESKLQLSDVASDIRTHLIESEHRGESLVSFAEKNGIDLMVVGETPRGNLSRFLLGSTSRYVLRHSPCSVWISRGINTSRRSEQVSQSEMASS
ncbi:universal stress protein [Rubripirellula amarantea]|nr:universal stress protein [Rubripirellula amarantea]